jgi:phage-related tail fiber protein
MDAVEAKAATNETNIAKKADKATTLAGYGITDAYTSAQVDTAIANAVGQFVEVSEQEILDLFKTA